MLSHPYILGDPQQRGVKSEVATSPLPSRGPKRGRKCYVTLAFSGIPNKGEQNQKWLPLGAQKRAEMLRYPCILRGPQRQVRGSKSSKLIHGQFHIGDGAQRHHLWGEEAQKGKNSNKNRGERVYRGIRYIKIACVYAPLYCLYSRIITQTAHRRARHRARRKRRRISNP